MAGLPLRAPGLSVWGTLTVAAIVAGSLAFGTGRGFEADAILVTSFGQSSVPAPAIVPEIFRINVDGSGKKALLPQKSMAFDPAVSPDGKLIAYVGSTEVNRGQKAGGTLGLFVMNADGSASKRIAENAETGEYVLAPSWSPDGKQIAFCTFVFGFRGNGTVFASEPQLHVVNADGTGRKRLGGANGFNPVWAPDGKRLLFTRSGGENGETSLCAVDSDGGNLRPLVTRRDRDADMIFGAWSPDGKWLAYSVLTEPGEGESGGLFLARADGSQARRLFGGPLEIVFGVQWSADGKQLYFTRRQLVPPKSGNEENANGNVVSTTFSPDRRQVFTWSGGRARVWDVESGEEIRAIEAQEIYRVVFSPDGSRLLGRGLHGVARLWDAESGKVIREFQANSVAFSHDGKQGLSDDYDKTTELWDAESGKVIRAFRGHPDVVHAVALSPDGKRVLTAGVVFAPERDRPDGPAAEPNLANVNTARLWDVDSGKEIRSFQAQSALVTAVAFSPDGKRLLTASVDGTTWVWDADSGKQIRAFQGRVDDFVAFSADGKRVFGKDWLGIARIWDTESAREIRAFATDSVAFSPDGKRLLVGGYDKKTRLCDADSGEEIRVFPGGSVALSADGKRVLTASGTVAHLWDTDSGKEIRAFEKIAQKIVPAPPIAFGVHVIDIDGRILRRVTAETERVYLGGNYVFAGRILLP